MDKSYTLLKEWLDNAKHIVFLTGAGISTGSKIPDIRGSHGLSKRKDSYIKYGANYETIVSHSFFLENPKTFFAFYKNEMVHQDAEPNFAHKALAKYDKKAIVITQNIDGLHQKAGSKNVIELHGSIYHNHCQKCHKEYELSYVMKQVDIPKCTCGGIIKPDVTLFEEPLDFNLLSIANDAMYHADLLVIIGSSLVVNPAASLVYSFKGNHIVIINKDATPFDGYADLIIKDPVEKVFQRLLKE